MHAEYILLLAGSLLVLPEPSLALDVSYAPESTTVAILPVVNLSGEKDDDQRDKQSISGYDELVKQFYERGFKIADYELVRKAVSASKIDFKDEESHKRANVIQIGKTVGATLVAFMVITDVHQKLNQNLFAMSREGRAKIKVWLLDSRSNNPIMGAVVFEGKSSGGPLAGLDKGSIRIVRAVGNGVKDALKDFLKPYPRIRKEEPKRG